MKILVLGSGAREHAIVHSLAHEHASSGQAQHELHVAPGNPGIGALAQLHAVDANDPDAVVTLAQQLDIDLLMIGPEAPLVAGVADAARAAGIATFGPSAQAARLEGSKAFAKEIMAAAGVPTARPYVCTTLDQVEEALAAVGETNPYVVKDDGLAAGKGVVVTTDRDEALAHAQACLEARTPDAAKVVIEEYLDGPEVSVFVVSDGTTVRALSPAQDFKRVCNDDAGPNTGGMGAYTPLTWAPQGLTEEVITTIAQPTIDEMARRGTPFVGILYVGLALTSAGTRVVEFNVRFGDPETQSVLARLETPLSQVLWAGAHGTLAQLPELQWRDETSVTVVLAARDYPNTPAVGDVITGVDEAEKVPGVHVLHAGTRRDESGAIVSSGGRVLSVVAVGADLDEARARAYEAIVRIALDGSHYRTDIALKAARNEITVTR